MSRLTRYEIANNPKLLRQMTVEKGQILTYEQQLNKLESMSRRRKSRTLPETPNPLDNLY